VIGDVDEDLSVVVVGLNTDGAWIEAAVGVLDAVGGRFVDHQHDVGDAGIGHPDGREPVGEPPTDFGQSFRGSRNLDAERLRRSRTRIESHARRCTQKGAISHARNRRVISV
jgi:hypothetical protein